MKSLEHTVSAQINDSSSIVNNKKLLLNLGNKTNLELLIALEFQDYYWLAESPLITFFPLFFPLCLHLHCLHMAPHLDRGSWGLSVLCSLDSPTKGSSTHPSSWGSASEHQFLPLLQ